MSAIFCVPPDPKNPVRICNVQTLGAMCGRFPTHEEAEAKLRRDGYADTEFWRSGNTVCYRGGINC